MRRHPQDPSLARDLHRRFLEAFPGAAPRAFFAPGRVNLVGAHLDYSGGTVLPMTVERGTVVAGRLREDALVRVRSISHDGTVEVLPEAIGERSDPAHGWASYVLGVWRIFTETTGLARGVDLYLAGNLPEGAGLSSSASLEVACAAVLNELHGAGLSREDLARIGFRAEREYVGLHCGIMDQYASALGGPGKVLCLDCSGPTYRYLPLQPGAMQVLVMHSGIPRRLAATVFNERVAECAQAHELLQQVRQRPNLAATTTEDLAQAEQLMPETLFKRARHVVAEVKRVVTAVAALEAGDMATLGRMLNESHASAGRDYGVSSTELDCLTAAARECPEVFGSRLTGAGFGGCAIALIKPGGAEAVQQHVTARYREQCGRTPDFTLLQDSASVAEVTCDAEAD